MYLLGFDSEQPIHVAPGPQVITVEQYRMWCKEPSYSYVWVSVLD
jgi:hypothetical protein